MLCQLVCVDRRYQRMNCFNIREIQSLLKRKFFTDLINSHDHHMLLDKTVAGLRYKTNNINSINNNIFLFYNYGIEFTPKIRNTFFNESSNNLTIRFNNFNFFDSSLIIFFQNFAIFKLINDFLIVLFFKNFLSTIFISFTSTILIIYTNCLSVLQNNIFFSFNDFKVLFFNLINFETFYLNINLFINNLFTFPIKFLKFSSKFFFDFFNILIFFYIQFIYIISFFKINNNFFIFQFNNNFNYL